MNRMFEKTWLAMLLAGAICAAPARADDDTAELRQQLDTLKKQVEDIKTRQAQRVDKEVEAYLAGNQSWSEAQQGGDGMKGITISSRITAVNQNTLNLEDGNNRAVVSGQVELMFGFKVNENLGIFADLIANTDGHLPSEFNTIPTLAGVFDGIGVDSSVTPRPTGGVQVYEAGIRYAMPAGDLVINMELGLLDPRNRFLTTAYSDDYRTQFLHNEFLDPSGVSWITNAVATPNSLGAYFWTAFGENKNFIVRLGWFNEEGRWVDNGQLYIEIHWKGEVQGRAMNAKFMFMRDGYYKLDGEDDNVWGFEWDWMATDNVGVFAQITGNTEGSNPVEMSWSIGAIWNGIFESRPDDQVGLAFGYLSVNEDVVANSPEDAEFVLEIYYKYITEDGKLQVTPHVMWVQDPGGGNDGWDTDDQLWILGVRIFVPF